MCLSLSNWTSLEKVILQGIKIWWKWKSESISHVRLCDLMDCSLPGSSVHGILQARVLEWVAVPFSRGSSWPRNRSQDSCIADDSLPSEPPRKPQRRGDQTQYRAPTVLPTALLQSSGWLFLIVMVTSTLFLSSLISALSLHSQSMTYLLYLEREQKSLAGQFLNFPKLKPECDNISRTVLE